MNAPSSVTSIDAHAPNPAHEAALTKLFSRMGELTTLPTQAARLLAIPNDDEASIEELVAIVQSDPPTSMRVLRRVNSSFYSLPNQVTEIPLAVSLLGIREMRNIALTASVSRMFSGGVSATGSTSHNREDLWMYSVAVAKAAAVIAQKGNRVSPHTAYAAGILHDIGYFILAQQLPTHYMRLVTLSRYEAEENLRITDLEEEVFTFNHAKLGGFAASKWGIPAPICAAIEYHHHFETYQGADRSLVACIVLAIQFCAELGWTSLGLPTAMTGQEAIYEAAGVKLAESELLRERIAKAVDEVAAAAACR